MAGPATWAAAGALAIALAAGIWLGRPGAGQAQEMLRAAAVVNDEVISVLDLNMRVRLAVLATGQEDTAESRKRVAPQVMRGLIDERLQAQEAQRLDITVPDDQVQSTIEQLARRNKLSMDAFFATVESRGIPRESLYDQVRAQLTWHALVNRRLRPSVQVSDEEVQEIVNRIVANRGSKLRRVAEIFLPVESVLQEDEVRENTERLLGQLRSGAEFSALARQFSQSATAAQGGDMGWIPEGQLAPELDAVLATMSPRTIAGPVRTPLGFHILLLLDVRQAPQGDVTLHVKQLLVALSAGANDQERQAATARAAALRERITGCEGVEKIAEESGAQGSGDLGTMKLSELPSALQEVVRALPIGQPSQPVPVANALSILLVCGRADVDIDRNAIREQIMTEQLDLLARRYMRDLRRKANVDIRI